MHSDTDRALVALTVKQAAERTGLTAYAVRALCREGKLGRFYGGKRKTYIIYEADVIRWIGGIVP